uniref:MYND-type domain-containing protein n=1 Tax=Ascaris suum TaxID=6253 RepID=F1KQT6_ASCSU
MESADRDRDQYEILVERLLDTISPTEERCSLNSVSISFDQSRDSVLDVSVCSNPIDESAIMEKSLADNTRMGINNVRQPAKDEQLSPALHIAAHSTPIPQTVARATTIPLLTSASGKETSNAIHSVPISNDCAMQLDLERSIRRFARYGQVYADSPKSHIHVEQKPLGTPSPPHEPPPPPPQPPLVPLVSPSSSLHSWQKNYRSRITDLRESNMSRDDYDTRSEPRSRSTMRDIPVQRGITSLPPSSATTVEYRSSSTPWNDNYQQQEYYRKEVMTRTYITRSTEALSAPPLSRSSPVLIERERYPSTDRYYPSTREERTVDYNYKYTKNIEDEERRIRDEQDRRRAEEDERRRREEEERRLWEIREKEYNERMRRERERKHRELESERLIRERLELERLEKEREAREQAEMQRRAEWERLEKERRALEERELEKRRALEKERLERQKLEEEQKERERMERERLERERERLEREKAEKERQERERIERERIEMERLEIERIERIKRERQERERIEREKEKEEAERRERERLEQERLAREKMELLRIEQELIEAQRREAEMREAERIEEENREARRREQERRDAELLAEMQRKAEEREAQRRLAERLEKERIENLRKEQERLELERQEADRRERQRMEEERREKELRDAQRRAAERREQERLEDERKERERQEAERREAERRERERREALRRERERQLEEEAEREKLAELERAAQERRAARLAEMQRDEQRIALERKAQEMKEMERIETERREKERLEEERRLAELRELEKRNAELRDKERREAREREAARRLEDRRSRDKLDQIAREIEEKEKMEAEKRRLLAQLDSNDKRREMLTSRETLEKLTKAPYYSKENLSQPFGSRENLGEVTTKVERQVIERVDRTYWSDEPRQRSTSVDLPSDVGLTSLRERIYHPRKTLDEDDFTRGSSRRTSRYRSKLEKARKEFLSTDTSPTSDPLSDRFQHASEDVQRPRPEYRGPLLQKFNSGDFTTKPDVDLRSYPRVGPSPYDEEYRRLMAKAQRNWAAYRQRMSQPNLYSRTRGWSTCYLETNLDTGVRDLASTHRQVEETNLDDVHRSGSVIDYARRSRRDVTDGETSHVRSKSADYLMDSKMREESAPPENELQKFGEKTPNISEHELRFRKSTEKLHVPDWYRERKCTKATDLDVSLDTNSSEPGTSLPGHGTTTQTSVYTTQYTSSYATRIEPPSLTQGQSSYSSDRYRYDSEPEPIIQTPASDSVSLPYGMFDKYKEEIEEMRRSRSSLHQLAIDDRKADEDFTAIRASNTQSATTVQKSLISAGSGKQLPGYTVTDVPSDWNVSGDRHSRVIEVADTFVGTKEKGESTLRYGGRVTIEEVLDSIFQQTKPSFTASSNLADTSLPQIEGDETNIDGPGIYTKNSMLMEQVIRDPAEAENLLKHERLFVRCVHCHKTKELAAARMQYISCKHCYTYYCDRRCRQWDWDRHKERCSFARINTLCKDVIMKVREDAEAQWFMSKIAREGYTARGRGSVNLRLSSAHLAQRYVTEGWSALAHIDLGQLLFYYTVTALVEERKEPSLIALCRKYDPNDKFILSVSIIADIEQCPQTPPPEPVVHQSATPLTMPDPQTGTIISPTSEPTIQQQHSSFSPSDEFRTAVPTEV